MTTECVCGMLPKFGTLSFHPQTFTEALVQSHPTKLSIMMEMFCSVLPNSHLAMYRTQ